MDIMPTDIATYPWAVLTTVELVFTRHVASCIVSVHRTVTIKASKLIVVKSVIGVTRCVVGVDGERLLATFSLGNTEAGGRALPVASRTGCKVRV